MSAYVITRAGWYLASPPVYGPTVTKELDQARRFPSVSAAYEYRRNHGFFEKYNIARINMWGHVEPFA